MNEELSPLKRAFLALEAAEGALERRSHGPVAIVGMGCRYPGGVESVDAFWDLIASGHDPSGEVPKDRLGASVFRGPPGPGRSSAHRGSFLEGVDRFDAAFFGISAREAARMDPQQRILLEVAWEALEDGAINPKALAGRDVGVWVGVGTSEWLLRTALSGDPEHNDAWAATGGLHSVVAGRLAYLLGLQGPVMAIDTACSSSLVAVDLACEALRRGSCEVALAGGVGVQTAPDPWVSFSQMGALAADGRCKTFDAAADGYGRGEGCGIVVLKRLEDALRDGDPVGAVILGSAVHHDGRSNGLTAPSGPAQARTVRRALENARIEPQDVTFVECHGTGTPLGDPIEVMALDEVLREGRSAGAKVHLGALKSQIGHLEAASGVAGLQKTVLALQRHLLPANLHFRQPNPHVPWEDLVVAPATEPIALDGEQTIAGVSAFGFSGTNAHVVLTSAPSPILGTANSGVPELVVLSARHPEALSRLAARLAKVPWGVADLAVTLGQGRAQLPVRAAFVASQHPEARDQLRLIAEGAPRSAARAGRIGLLFTGQGAFRPEIGREILETWPAFAEAVGRVAAVMDPLLPRPLLEVWSNGDEALLTRTLWQQTLTFALQIGLLEGLRGVGLEAEAVAGHSIGEFAAAVAAGVWTEGEAALLVAKRALAMEALADGGAMIALRADEAAVRTALEGVEGVGIAALNGDEVVISGDEAAVEALAAKLGGGKRLAVSHAFHSHRMAPAQEALREALRGLNPRGSLVRFPGNLHGRPEDWRDPDYWVRQVREPVRFADALGDLVAQGIDTFVELGPRGVLSALGASRHPEARFIPTFGAGRGPLHALGELFEAGHDLDLRSLRGERPGRKIHLPVMPWVRESFWTDDPRRPVAQANHCWIPAWEALPVGPLDPVPAEIVVWGPDEGWFPAVLGARIVVRDEEAHDSPHSDAPWAWRWPQGDPAAALIRAVALSRRRIAQPGPLWLLTRGAHDGSDPDQAAAWGFGRVLAAEHPELDVRLVDLDAGAPPHAAFEGLRRASEVRVGERDFALLAVGLVPARTALEPSVPGEGALWISGGRGGIGRVLAERLVERGHRHLVLLGRTAPDAETEAWLGGLRARGARVDAPLVDVTDAEALRALRAETGPVRAVIHGAGALSPALIDHLEAPAVEAAVRAKVAGLWALDEATRGEPLEAFVVLGSAAAWSGALGQGAYAAANAILEAWVARRQGEGRPGAAVSFGPWRGTGMGQGFDARRARADALLDLDPDEGLTLIEHALARPRGVTVMARPNAEVLGAADRLPPRLAGWAPARSPAAAVPSPAALGPEAILALVQRQVLATLGRPDGELPGPEVHLSALGFDSLLAVDLRQRLHAATGQLLPLALVMEGGPLGGLAERLAGGPIPPKAPASHAVADPSGPPEPPFRSTPEEPGPNPFILGLTVGIAASSAAWAVWSWLL